MALGAVLLQPRHKRWVSAHYAVRLGMEFNATHQPAPVHGCDERASVVEHARSMQLCPPMPWFSLLVISDGRRMPAALWWAVRASPRRPDAALGASAERSYASRGALTCRHRCVAVFAIKRSFDGTVPLREVFQRLARHLQVIQLGLLIGVTE